MLAREEAPGWVQATQTLLGTVLVMEEVLGWVQASLQKVLALLGTVELTPGWGS